MRELRYAVLNEKNFVEHIIDIKENKEMNFAFSPKEIVQMFFPDKKIIEVSEKTGIAYVDSLFFQEHFTDPQPYPSWVWDKKQWVAPEKYPNNGCINFWEEKEKKWKAYSNEDLMTNESVCNI